MNVCLECVCKESVWLCWSFLLVCLLVFCFVNYPSDFCHAKRSRLWVEIWRLESHRDKPRIWFQFYNKGKNKPTLQCSFISDREEIPSLVVFVVCAHTITPWTHPSISCIPHIVDLWYSQKRSLLSVGSNHASRNGGVNPTERTSDRKHQKKRGKKKHSDIWEP